MLAEQNPILSPATGRAFVVEDRGCPHPGWRWNILNAAPVPTPLLVNPDGVITDVLLPERPAMTWAAVRADGTPVPGITGMTLEQAVEALERDRFSRLADLRYPEDRPIWLGTGQPWPCGRCGNEVDEETPHECRQHPCGDYPAPCNCDDPTTHNGH